VGESLSLLPIAQRLADERPELALLITSGTTASAEVLARRLPPGAIHQYAPVDTPQATARFLDHWRPDLGILGESDLWPNLIMGARARGARLALVSARLSARSAARWTHAPATVRALLGAFDRILARDEASAHRLSALGGQVSGVVDLKVGAAPLAAEAWALSDARGAISGRPVILAASTHPGEEELILQAFRETMATSGHKPALIIAPRHPARGEAIAAAAGSMGLLVGRRALGTPLEGLDVYVADTVGEMGVWYRLASLAIIGGSLTERGRGHNPLEPARLDCPFVSGPFTQDWPVYERLVRVGATQIIQPDRLAPLMAQTLTTPDARADMARRARVFVTAGDQETDAAISRLLEMATW
jgi:3-deoxy-D-manno-octulosonic-acid transferase